MSHRVPLLLAILLSASGAAAQEGRPATPVAPDATASVATADVRGVWKVTQVASRSPGGEWEPRPAPYVSQFIFTDKHYSYMYVPGSEPRGRFAGGPNAPSDAEKIAAYQSFVGATGSYSLSGRALTMNALVHKNPNEMGGTALVYTVTVGGGTIRMVTIDPPFLPGRELRMVLTRVE
jgi:hypothetical protein